MSEERNLILKMLAEGKITVEEAEQLLDALEASSTKESAEERKSKCASSWSTADFGDMFGDIFGEEGPFGKEGPFGEEGLFNKFFGAKCGVGRTGRKSAKSKKEEQR